MVGDTNDSNTTCGLALIEDQVQVQNAVSVNTATSTTITASYSCWELVGWVNCTGANGSLVRISSISNCLATPVALPSGATDVAAPIVGGHWEEFGLMYDGISLQLLRNGQLVAQLPNPTTPTVPGLTTTLLDSTQGAPAVQNIYLGQGLLGKVANATATTYLQGTLDNCRLFRLGTEQPVPLPSGVAPLMGYTLQVRPDGVIAFSSDVQSVPVIGAGVMQFKIMGQATNNGASVDNVSLTLQPDGSFLSTITTGAAASVSQ